MYKEEAKSSSRVEKTIGALHIPDMSREELMDRLKRMKAITPTGLAIQFNIKVSMTKNLRRSSRSRDHRPGLQEPQPKGLQPEHAEFPTF